MGVPASEVGYTIATTRRENHEVRKNRWWHQRGKGEKKKAFLPSLDWNNTAHGIYHYTAYKLHTVVYYFQNAICSHDKCIQVISFGPTVGANSLSCNEIMKLTTAQHYYVQTSYTKFHTTQTVYMESTDRNSHMSSQKVWLPLSWNPHSLNSHWWTCPPINYIQSGWKTYQI